MQLNDYSWVFLFLKCWMMLFVDTSSAACFSALKLNWCKYLIGIPVSLQLWCYHLSLLLQDGSEYHHCDFKDIWCGLQYQNVTFCCSVYGISDHRCLLSLNSAQIHRPYRTSSMNVDWLVLRSHLSLILQNSVHPSERELVIRGLQGAIIDYCFREWLTPSCFVFARRETSEETVWRQAENELQLGVSSIV